MDYIFVPNVELAIQFNQGFKTALVSSLEYIADELKDNPEFGIVLRTITSKIKKSTWIHPAVYGYYYELVFAAEAQAWDTFANTLQALQSLNIDLDIKPQDIEILDLFDSSLDSHRQLYLSHLNNESANQIDCDPLTKNQFQQFQELWQSSQESLIHFFPELLAEIQQLIRQLVLAVPSQSSGLHFHGASFFSLWGLLFLNPEPLTTQFDLLLTLAHEAGHSVLFGYSMNEPLLRNQDTELYESPLRQERRPMAGVYHATFVTARMHLLASRVLKTGWAESLGSSNTAVKETCQDLFHTFEEGLNTVKRFAQLTDSGASILARAESYMYQKK
ncbi:HEXXH motif-containing putative peptide modification protein [Synechocystis sp. LKSZ1]|uniref:aKG-HExxH-type peptide beta-hydroxylase n=1 Tax=Synechocystis sp. LKSZ1 TaxID=3144951 RepID=UPI00336BEF78